MTSILSYASNLLDKADDFASKESQSQTQQSPQIHTTNVSQDNNANAIITTNDASLVHNNNDNNDNENENTLISQTTETITIAREQHTSNSNTTNISADSSSEIVHEQYQGLLKLWNQERKNAKIAKDQIRRMQERIQDMNLRFATANNCVMIEHQKSIQNLESDLQECLHSKMTQKERICGLEEQLSVLNIKQDSISTENSQRIQLLRNEFLKQRTEWEKERQILNMSLEKGDFKNQLQSENSEYINALARNQSCLQQSQMENSRLTSEITWLKSEATNTQQQFTLICNEKTKVEQILYNMKQDNQHLTLELQDAQNQISKLKTNLKESLVQQQEQKQEPEQETLLHSSQAQAQAQKSLTKSQTLHKHKLKALSNKIIKQQSELDFVICQKNEIENKYLILQQKYQLIQNQMSNQVTINITNQSNLDEKRTQFDRLGVKINQYLKLYPGLRVLLLGYIIVLHIFVYIILHLQA